MASDFGQEILKILDSRTISNRNKIEDHIKSYTDKTLYDRSYSEYELDSHLRELGKSILRLQQEFTTRDNVFFAKKIAKMVNLATERWSQEIDKKDEEINELTVKLLEKERRIKELERKK
ncbi:MAG: hypothetical protein ACXAEU_25990 [Candidatus Hodarchaeales archaeon]|jgi:predicted RNase H-like nuclease (RuvC/YqgF family)